MTSNNAIIPIEQPIEPSKYYSDIMKYPCVVMRLSGLYCKSGDRKLIKAYNILVLCLIWYNTLKSINWFNIVNGSGTDPFNGYLVYKIVVVIWLVMCSVHGLLVFAIQLNVNKIDKVEEMTNILFQYEQTPVKTVRVLKRTCFILLNICLLSSLINCAVGLLGLFSSDQLFFSAFTNLICVYNPDQYVSVPPVFKVFSWITFIYTNQAWFMSFGYFLGHVILICKLSKSFNIVFERFASSRKKSPLPGLDVDSLSDEEYFNELFEWYLKLVALVRVSNKCFTQFIGVSLVSYLPITLLLLFIISNWTGNCITGIFEVLYPFWLILAVLFLFGTILSTSRISYWVCVLIIFWTNNLYIWCIDDLTIIFRLETIRIVSNICVGTKKFSK